MMRVTAAVTVKWYHCCELV